MDDILSMDEFKHVNAMDKKQQIAFDVICCTFILNCIEEITSSHAAFGDNSTNDTRINGTKKVISTVLDGNTKSTLSDLIKDLKRRSGKDQLLMFLSGKGGSGKSFTIFAAEKYCHRFCQFMSLPFEKTSIYLTAMTGSAAALLNGITLHLATHFESTKKINDVDRSEWESVRILVIDECSFCSQQQLELLDKRLRRLRSQLDKPYGGINIIFIGDFHQIVPFQGDPLYSKYCLHWHGLINTVVFLQNDHRFKDDPEYGRLVERFSNGTATKNDIKLVNSRLLNNGKGNGGIHELPKDDTNDICYACAYNAERNSITTSIFSNYVNETHKMNASDLDLSEIPKDVVIIESAMFDKNGERCSANFESKVYNMCGDADVKAGRTKKVDPALKFYAGVPLMITDNKFIKDGRGNGTKCIGLKIKMKKDCVVDCKNWDGRLIHIVSSLDVEYMICETIPSNDGEAPKKIKLKADRDSVKVSIKVANMKHIMNVKMVQFAVNSNKATTGHNFKVLH